MKPNRNDPCPCGNGKKYKHCCELKAAPRPATPTAADFDPLLALFNTRRYAELEIQVNALLTTYPDAPFAWQLLGGALQMQGKPALTAFQKVAELSPHDAGAHFNLGVTFKSAGQLEQAASSYRRALALKSDYVEALSNLGNVLQDLGQFDEAVQCYRRALRIQPKVADTHYNLGNALRGLKQLEQAAQCYQQAVTFKPDFAAALSTLGATLYELGRTEEALRHYKKSLEINPYSADTQRSLGKIISKQEQFDQVAALFNSGQLEKLKAVENRAQLLIKQFPELAIVWQLLGVCLHQQGKYPEALPALLNAVKFLPDDAEVYYNLGITQASLGLRHEAVASYRHALRLNNGFAEAYNNLAEVLTKLNQPKDAADCCRRALEIKPNYVGALNNLGNALVDLGQRDSAVSNYHLAISLDPNFAEAHNNLGNTFNPIGQINDALSSYRKALAIKPDYFEAHSNLLMASNYTALSPADYLSEARRFGEQVAQKVTTRYAAWQCVSQPQTLRVGVVSADLHGHPVGYFLESLLAQLDPARIELIAYTNNPISDDLTARIKPYFSAWKPVFALNDRAAAQLIHDDGVHVLLDLSGHTAKNRLPVFAWKPAPVQVSWLGYFASTGVAEMDFVLADETGVPRQHRSHFSETVWYLPDTRLCFTPPDTDLTVAPLPSLSNRFVTFGCYQNLAKVTDEVLTVWGRVFAALPQARLRLASKYLKDPSVVAQLQLRLQQCGIEASRVLLHAAVPRQEYLAAHAEVDMLLDTFPYPGGTTTCESLWMGVPTLTLAGDTLLSRQGASLMTAAGLPDWIAESEDEYVTKAIQFSQAIPRLAALRAGLREQVRVSPLFDAPRFAKHFEQALWRMWQANQERSV